MASGVGAAEHGVVVAEDAEEVDDGAVANGGDARDGLVHRDAQPEPARRRRVERRSSAIDRPGRTCLFLREEARESPALGPHHPRVLAYVVVVRVAPSAPRPVVVELRDEPDDAPGQRQRPDLRGLGRGCREVRLERLQLRPLFAPEGVVVGEHLHGGTRMLRHGDPPHRARSDCDRRPGGALRASSSSFCSACGTSRPRSRHLLSDRWITTTTSQGRCRHCEARRCRSFPSRGRCPSSRSCSYAPARSQVPNGELRDPPDRAPDPRASPARLFERRERSLTRLPPSSPSPDSGALPRRRRRPAAGSGTSTSPSPRSIPRGSDSPTRAPDSTPSTPRGSPSPGAARRRERRTRRTTTTGSRTGSRTGSSATRWSS